MKHSTLLRFVICVTWGYHSWKQCLGRWSSTFHIRFCIIVIIPSLCSPHARLRADPVILGTYCVCMYGILIALLIEPQQSIFRRLRQLYDFMSNLGFFVPRLVTTYHLTQRQKTNRKNRSQQTLSHAGTQDTHTHQSSLPWSRTYILCSVPT